MSTARSIEDGKVGRREVGAGKKSQSEMLDADWELSDAPRAAWSGIVSSSSGQYAVATVSYGQIYYSFNYGENWSFSNAPAQSWNDVASDSVGQQVIAVGTEIYISKDFGYSWTKSSAPKSLWLGVASSANGDLLYAANGESGGIYVSTNNGTDWTPLSPPSVLSAVTGWGSVECSGTGQYVYAAAHNMIYASEDFGASWSATNLTLPQLTSSVALAVADDGLTVVAAMNYGDLFYSWEPNEWRLATPPTPRNYSAVAIDFFGQNVIATTWSGEMYIDSDYGRSWSFLASPGGLWSGVAMDDSGANLIAVQNTGQIYYFIGGTPEPPVPTPIPLTLTPSLRPSFAPTTLTSLEQSKKSTGWASLSSASQDGIISGCVLFGVFCLLALCYVKFVRTTPLHKRETDLGTV